MRSFRYVLSLGLLVGTLLICRSAQADTVTNGNFNTGDLSGFTVFTTSNGTNGSGLPNIVSFDTTGNGASNAAHFNVGEVAFDGLEQGGGLSQNIYIAADGIYTVSESFASSLLASTAPYNNDAGTFSLLLNGTAITSQSLGFINGGSVIRGNLTNTLHLNAGTYLLQTQVTRHFNYSGGVTPDQYIDNLAVVNNSVSATPEPSGLALLGTGVLGVIGAVRRRLS